MKKIWFPDGDQLLVRSGFHDRPHIPRMVLTQRERFGYGYTHCGSITHILKIVVSVSFQISLRIGVHLETHLPRCNEILI